MFPVSFVTDNNKTVCLWFNKALEARFENLSNFVQVDWSCVPALTIVSQLGKFLKGHAQKFFCKRISAVAIFSAYVCCFSTKKGAVLRKQ